MNDKYCKLIRKVVRDWGHSKDIAKALKKDLKRSGITTPSFEFLVAVMETVDKKIQQSVDTSERV
jgi:hypothetical protein